MNGAWAIPDSQNVLDEYQCKTFDPKLAYIESAPDKGFREFEMYIHHQCIKKIRYLTQKHESKNQKQRNACKYIGDSIPWTAVDVVLESKVTC